MLVRFHSSGVIHSPPILPLKRTEELGDNGEEEGRRPDAQEEEEGDEEEEEVIFAMYPL